MDFSSDSLLIWKTAAVALWFLLFFAGERLAPAVAWPPVVDAVRPGFVAWGEIWRSGK